MRTCAHDNPEPLKPESMGFAIERMRNEKLDQVFRRCLFLSIFFSPRAALVPVSQLPPGSYAANVTIPNVMARERAKERAKKTAAQQCECWKNARTKCAQTKTYL